MFAVVGKYEFKSQWRKCKQSDSFRFLLLWLWRFYFFLFLIWRQTLTNFDNIFSLTLFSRFFSNLLIFISLWLQCETTLFSILLNKLKSQFIMPQINCLNICLNKTEKESILLLFSNWKYPLDKGLVYFWFCLLFSNLGYRV